MNRVQAPPAMIAVGTALRIRSGNAVRSVREPFRYGQGVATSPGYRPGTMAPRVPTHLAGPDRSMGVSRIPTRTHERVTASFDRGGAAGTRGARTIMEMGLVRVPLRATPAGRVIAMAEAVTGPAGTGRAETWREGQARVAASIPRRYAERGMSGTPFYWGGVTRAAIPGSTITPGFTPKLTQVLLPAGAVLPLPGSPGYAGSTSIRTPTPSPMRVTPQSGSTDLAPFVTSIDPAPTTIGPTPFSPVAASPGSATTTVPLDTENSSSYQGYAMEKPGSSDLVDGFDSPSWTPPPPAPAPAEPAGLSGGAKVAIAVGVGLALAACLGRKRRR